MPVLLSTAEMNDLAQKLAKMRFRRAKGYIRGMDKHSHLDMYRVAVGTDEWHTRWSLPTKGLWITLIEKKEEYGPPNGMGRRKIRFQYVQARVEPMPDYAYRDIGAA
jgi:hypothetical protein